MTRRLLTPPELIRETDADPQATSRERAMANALDAMVEYFKQHPRFSHYESTEHRLVHTTYPVES